VSDKDGQQEPERPRIRVQDKRGLPKDEQPSSAVQEEANVDAQKLAEERLDHLMRLKADFENYRKRVIREQTDLVERASLRIVERLLPVLDDLERALQAAKEHEPDAIVRGVELVHKHLHDVLVDEGLERVAAEGAFDPQEHEAVSSVPGDVAEPTILEIVRPGYRLKGKTIRPALVHVSVPGNQAPPPEDEGE
jgi:molecular chaperone GrpE